MDIFPTYIQPYLKIDKVCSDTYGSGAKYIDPTSCGYTKENFWKRRDKDYTQSFMATSSHGTNMHRTMVRLQTGAVILFQPFSCSGEPQVCTSDSEIIIDIDGPKGKNVYGRDVFLFKINLDKNKLEPVKNNYEIEKIKNKCRETGHWCAAWIVRNGWKIPKDYPWD